MKITHVTIPHKLRPNGQVMRSDAVVQELLRGAGVSVDVRGVPRHPFEMWRLSLSAEGDAVYECRQGERA